MEREGEEGQEHKRTVHKYHDMVRQRANMEKCYRECRQGSDTT